MIILLFGSCAGALSEIITIAVPEKIIAITQKEPEDLLNTKFYRFVFTLSGVYFITIILLFFSGINRFQVYALILLIISVTGWNLRRIKRGYMYLLLAESTICLILLLDIVRSLYGEIMVIL